MRLSREDGNGPNGGAVCAIVGMIIVAVSAIGYSRVTGLAQVFCAVGFFVGLLLIVIGVASVL